MATPAVETRPASRARTLLVNNLWLSASVGASLVAGLLNNYVNSHYLGLIIFGQYSLLQSSASYWGISGGGVGTALLKSAARNEESTVELIGAGAVLQTTLAVAMMGVAMPVAVWSLHDSRTTIPALLMATTGVFLALMNSPVMIFSGKNRMRWQILGGFQTLGATGLLIILVFAFPNVGLYAPVLATLVMAIFVCAGVYLYAEYREGRLRLPPPQVIKRLALDGLFLTAVPLTQLIYYELDPLLVSWFSKASELGILSAANGLLTVLRQMAWVSVMGILPLMVVDAQREHKELNQTVNDSLLWLVLGGGVVTTAVITASKLIVAILYPKTFSAAINVLCVYALCFVPLLAHWTIMNTLVAINRSLSLGIPYLIASAIKVIGGLWIVRIYGALGMAALSIFTELILAGIFCGMLMHAREFRLDSKFGRAVGWVAVCLAFIFVVPILPRWTAGAVGALAIAIGGIYITGLHYNQLKFLFRALCEGKRENAGL